MRFVIKIGTFQQLAFYVGSPTESYSRVKICRLLEISDKPTRAVLTWVRRRAELVSTRHKE